MKTRKLGTLEVSALGFGCMNLATNYGPAVPIDDAPGVAQKYGIRGVPTLAVFRAGEKTASHVGVTTKAKLIELLETQKS